ncbi:hypothetical protein HHI36_015556 [Cryptolaemus montrouzieri]|uniref:Protein sleepless n=1 Tax=Cryptolaemus montrouzieri TaxID=559131 RepID=A0ABD2N629_9CUCU
MILENHSVAVFLGIISLINSAYGLKCYKCNAANDEVCARGSSSLPTTECASFQNRCGVFEYDILAGSSKVIGTGYQRDCASTDGYCELVSKGANLLLRGATNGEAGIQQRRCDLCEDDFCNASNKIKGSLFLLFVLISCNIARFF